MLSQDKRKSRDIPVPECEAETGTVQLAAKPDTSLLPNTTFCAEEEIIGIHRICYGYEDAGKSSEQPNGITGRRQVDFKQVSPCSDSLTSGQTGRENADICFPDIGGIGADRYLKAGMLKIQYLGPEDLGSTVIQHEVVDDSQRRCKTGNLTTYPPNTHYCQTCHSDTLWASDNN